MSSGLTYAQSGVDIDAGNRMVELIKPLVRATARPAADAEIGGFGMIAVVDPAKADAVTQVLAREGETVTRFGEAAVARANAPRVIYDGRLDLA